MKAPEGWDIGNYLSAGINSSIQYIKPQENFGFLDKIKSFIKGGIQSKLEAATLG